jgi:acyl carrier protein
MLEKIISERLGCELHQVKDNSHFVDDLGADSLDTVELVLDVEKEYGIHIPDEEVDKLVTVALLREFIEEHK